MGNNRRPRQDSPDDSESGETDARPVKLARSDRSEEIKSIERLMAKLSDPCIVTVQRRIADLSRYVGDRLDMYKMDLVRLLVECIDVHPTHSGAYATFVGLLNVRDYEFGGRCVTSLMKQMLKSLNAGQWSKARGLLLLLGDLVNANVVTAGSLLQLLGAFASICEEVESPQRRREYYAYIVLSTLALVGRELYEKKEEGLMELLKRLQLFMKDQSSCVDGVQMLSIGFGGDMREYEYLTLLWQQILRLQRDNWIEQHLLRPYLAFDDTLSVAMQHQLPELDPQQLASNRVVAHPPPWLVFRLFKLSDIPPNVHMPDDLDIGRLAMESQILETLQQWHYERKICAEQLLELCVARPMIAMQHLIVEVLLIEMLQLPSSPYLTINYGAIIIELCKLQPDKFPRIIVQAASIIYGQLEFMAVSSSDRFINWLSHHLSNFRFEWQWEDWSSCIVEHELHPSSMFMRELLKKCMRLSYHQHIVQMMPASFAKLLPVTPDPDFKYINVLLPGAMLAKHLLEAIRGRCEPELIGGLLEAATDLEERLKVNILMQTLLHIGCKSLTHVNGIFCKFQPVLKMLASSDDGQLAMLEALFELWAKNEQLKLVVAGRLLKMNIVSSRNIVSWVFDPSQKRELTKMYMWELLDVTIKFTKNRPRVIEPGSDARLQVLLLHIVTSCSKVISKHCASATGLYLTYWLHFVLGRLQGVLFNYIDDVRGIRHKLRQISSEPDTCKELVDMIEKYLVYTYDGTQELLITV